jgi:hypothetical protein
MDAVGQYGGCGPTSRGTSTCLIIPALSTTDVVPVISAPMKKLNGTRPHNTKTGNGCSAEHS